MQKTIVAALALIASTAVATAADLPSKQAPAAPVLPTFTQSYYVGGNIGGNVSGGRVYSGGAVAGWNALPFLAVEGTYDLSRPQNQINGSFNYRNDIVANLVPQYSIPSYPITIYGLAGTGYRWQSIGADYAIFNVGGGVKYEVTQNFEVDARYRFIDAYKKELRDNENRITLGVNYKF